MNSTLPTVLALCFSVAAEAQIARIAPERPVAAPAEGARALNFELVVRNDSDVPITLATFGIEVFDRNGGRILHRALNEHGSAPSIEILPNRRIAPGAEQIYFNPFVRVPADARAARIVARMEFAVDGDAAKRLIEARARVSDRKEIEVEFPLHGRVLVWDGHDEFSHHRRWNYTLPFLRQLGFTSNGMRYAYDFVIVDERGEMISGDRSRNESWFGFGAPVSAAAAGIVVKSIDGHPDDRSFDPNSSLRDPNALFGNYIVTEQNGVFTLYGHLRQNSTQVKVGDRVRAGQQIASVGNSGSAEFPHLHFQLMDAADMRGEGLPAVFREFRRVMGERRVARHHASVETGDVIEAIVRKRKSP